MRTYFLDVLCFLFLYSTREIFFSLFLVSLFFRVDSIPEKHCCTTGFKFLKSFLHSQKLLSMLEIQLQIHHIHQYHHFHHFFIFISLNYSYNILESRSFGSDNIRYFLNSSLLTSWFFKQSIFSPSETCPSWEMSNLA